MSSIRATLVRFENSFAVFSHETAGEFKWPVSELHEHLSLGETIELRLITPKMEQDEKYERMRKLLEELIN